MVKGFIKTLEAAIAVALIFVSMIFLFPENIKKETKISDTAYKCLLHLDYSGYLRNYAYKNMESNLISDLEDCIPPLFNYTARICSTTLCTTDIPPTNKTVFLSSYLIAGENSFEPKLINLWVWSK